MKAQLDRRRAIEVVRSRLRLSDNALRVDLPELYPTQEEIKLSAARFNCLCVGRRAGKTYLGVRLALEAMLRGQRVGWFAPTYKLLSDAWLDLLRPLKPIMAQCHVDQSQGVIELPNGGRLEAWSLNNNPDAGRSRKYHLVIVDEAAVAPKLRDAWEEGISPTLVDYRGSAWFLSTPKGLNYFYDLFRRGQDTLTFPDWRSWQLPSSVNPFLPPDELERERQQKPALAFQQEFLAEFISGEGAVFRNVDACLTAEPDAPASHARHYKVIGVDWAQSHDFTCFSVVCCDCKKEVALDRFNQVGWALQRGRLLALVEKWQPQRVEVEENSIGRPNLEELQANARWSQAFVGFKTLPSTKPKLIQSLALAFEREDYRWLKDDTARLELLAYEATRTITGHIQYSAPEGQHDDTVIARALALRAAEKTGPRPLTHDEKVEEAISPGYRFAELQEKCGGRLTPEAELAYVIQRQDARKRIQPKHQTWDELTGQRKGISYDPDPFR